MSQRTLFLAWQDKRPASRRWFPVGRLDIESTPMHRFRYVHGAIRAKSESGFLPLLEFPDFRGKYESTELFALFRNRVMARGRPDRLEYLVSHDLREGADPFEVLSVNGGSRVTDTYEVFPKIKTDDGGAFMCRFFLRGWRYVSGADSRISALKQDEKLDARIQFDNPITGKAVKILSRDGTLLGWTPRYLVHDLIVGSDVAENEDKSCVDVSNKYLIRVVRVNDVPAPSSQRLLIELRGRWDDYEPMSGEDFELLA